MVNIGFGVGSMVGIALAVAGAGLYFLRSMRPGLARDQDIFFAAIALLCGGILFFQGWRLDPILQFAQFLSAGSAIWFAFEAVRLRGITTEQAKRSTPVVDDERPVSRVYRAELDDLPPLDERSNTRRIRGSRDSRTGEEGYSDRRSNDDRTRRSRDSRPLPPERTTRRGSDRSDRNTWDDDDFGGRASRSSQSDWGDDLGTPMRDSGSSRSDLRDSSSRSSSRRRPQGSSRRRGSASDADYVDYQPINFSDDDLDSPR